MRISDLAQFRFEMITRDWKITVKEVKTGKIRTVVLNNTCQKAIRDLKDYYKELGFKTSTGYFFKSLSHYNVKHKLDMPITINGVSKEFLKLHNMLNIQYPIDHIHLGKQGDILCI